jgi:hypothetical protein
MLRPMPIKPIPPETARVARPAFPKANRYLRVTDELDTLFTDEAFIGLFPTHGQPAFPPWRLALVTLLQFAEEPPIAKRPTRCAAASIGNICCAWSSQTPGSMPWSSVNFAAA